MIKAFLLDVNERDLYTLSSLLQQSGRVNVVGMATHPERVVESILRLQPDVLFLDLQMPGLAGFLVAEHAKQKLPELQVVVVTGSKQHALWAFDQAIADYVLKPLEEVRLGQSLDRLGGGV